MSKMSNLLIPRPLVDRADRVLEASPPSVLLALTSRPTPQQLLRHALDVGLLALEGAQETASTSTPLAPTVEDEVSPGRVAAFFFAALDLPLSLVPLMSLSGRAITYEVSLALEHSVEGYDQLETATGSGPTPEAAIGALARALTGLKVWTRSPPGGRYTDKLEWTIEAFPALASSEDLERAMAALP